MISTRVLFDYNNLACRCVHLRMLGNSDRSWSLLAYMVFENILNFSKSVFECLDAGDKIEVVLALDSVNGYWRRNLYQPYKADRARKREDDGVDWSRAYVEFEKLSSAIARYTPWKVLRVPDCEADDIIYALSENANGGVVIHSGDSDYLQLVSDSVALFSPTYNDYVDFPRECRVSGAKVYCETPGEYLRYAILTGQGGKDNVYNVKTPTDWDCGKRKPGFGAAAATKLLAKGDLDKELEKLGLLENYLRNKRLIDMRELPDSYKNEILACYKKLPSQRSDMEGLLSEYDWPSLSPGPINAQLDMFANGKLSEAPVVVENVEVSTEEAYGFSL